MEQASESRYREHDIEWDDHKIARLWDYYSRTPPYSDIYFSKLFGRDILKLSEVSLKESINFLDFGSGLGFIWDHLRAIDSRWQYSAIDFSPDSVSALAAKAAGQPNFVTVKLVEAMPLPFESGVFDLIFLIEVVEHLTDAHLDATLAEVRRLLRSGGRVVISTPHEENLNLSRRFCPDCGSKFHEWQHVRSWSISTLQSALQKHGLAMHKAMALDFNERGWSGPALRLRVKRMLLQLSGVKRKLPHLIAIFEKSG